MPRKKKRPASNRWERPPGSSVQFISLHYALLDSAAWHALTPKQQQLYIYCKRESHGSASQDNEKANGYYDASLFYMNRALVTKVHRLYKGNDWRGFDRDMAALIERGFVDCVRSGYEKREKTLYRLSDRWQAWGSEEYTVPGNVKTTHMKLQEKKR